MDKWTLQFMYLFIYYFAKASFQIWEWSKNVKNKN